MNFDSEWDVDSYRKDHESDLHWKFRRDFMLANKHKFPENRLVCLGQIFTNIEFLGCSYPKETMDLVAKLSKGIAEEYREERKMKLQHTFVLGSEAASEQIKGLEAGKDQQGRPDPDLTEMSTKMSGEVVNDQIIFSGVKNSMRTLEMSFIAGERLVSVIQTYPSEVGGHSSDNKNDAHDLKLSSGSVSKHVHHNYDIESARAATKPSQENEGIKFEENLSVAFVQQNANISEKYNSRGLEIDVNDFPDRYRDFIVEVGSILRNYANSGPDYALVFPPHCNRTENEIICTIALCLNLKIASVGCAKGKLIISKSTNRREVQELLRNNISSSRYKLMEPKHCSINKLCKIKEAAAVDSEIHGNSNQDQNSLQQEETGFHVPDSYNIHDKSCDEGMEINSSGNNMPSNEPTQSLEEKFGAKMHIIHDVQQNLNKSEYNARDLGIDVDDFPDGYRDFIVEVGTIMKNYGNSNPNYALVFPSHCNRTEKEIITKIAPQLNLKIGNVGGGGKRKVIISKVPDKEVKMLLRSNIPSSKYKLIEPIHCSHNKLLCEIKEVAAFDPEVPGSSIQDQNNLQQEEAGCHPQDSNNIHDESCAEEMEIEIDSSGNNMHSSEPIQSRLEKVRALISSCSELRKFVIIEQATRKFGARKTLIRSGEANNMKVDFRLQRSTSIIRCDVYIGSYHVYTHSTSSVDGIRAFAAENVLKLFKEQCPTLIVKNKFFSQSTIDRASLNGNSNESNTEGKCLLSTPLSEDNVWTRMLHQMRWTGGGLGKKNEGIEEPISGLASGSKPEDGAGPSARSEVATSPVPAIKRRQGSRGRKAGTSNILTSSPYKTSIEMSTAVKKEPVKNNWIEGKSPLPKDCESSDSDSDGIFSVRDDSSDLSMSDARTPSSDDAECLFCSGQFSDDKHGEEWVKCEMCDMWVHTECARYDNELYICNFCKLRQNVKRAGLGIDVNCATDFETKLRELMRNFAKSDSLDDLIFSSEFSTEERTVMAGLANLFQLRSKCCAKKRNKYMVIYKPLHPRQIVAMLCRKGCSSEKYDLILPDQSVNTVQLSEEGNEVAAVYPEVPGSSIQDQNSVQQEETGFDAPDSNNIHDKSCDEGMEINSSGNNMHSSEPVQSLEETRQLISSCNELRKFVIVEQASRNFGAKKTLIKSGKANNMKIDFRFQKSASVVRCDVYIASCHFYSVSTPSVDRLTTLAAKNVLKLLKEQCPTLIVKNEFFSQSTIDRASLNRNSNESNTEGKGFLSTPLSDDYVGNEMLHQMGWTGGGLGKDNQRIEEPIRVQQNVERAGLDIDENCASDFETRLRELMRNFVKSDSLDDLIFSSEFTTEEKTVMAGLANLFQLKSKWCGKKGNKYMVIYKPLHPRQIVAMLCRKGCSSEKYDLILPDQSVNTVQLSEECNGCFTGVIMSFDTDWDVDSYRDKHDSEEHWELRKNFMLAHKDKFPEDKLVCLTQVFANMEFLGCRYPAETMKLVAHLAEGIVDDYRENKKSKLQRTFVQGSEAASAKIKGLKRVQDQSSPQESTSKSVKYSCGQSASEKPYSSSEKSRSLYSNFTSPSGYDSYNNQQANSFQESTENSSGKYERLNPSYYSVGEQDSFSPNSKSPLGKSRYGGVKTYNISPTNSSGKFVQASENNCDANQQKLLSSLSVSSPALRNFVVVEYSGQNIPAVGTLGHSAAMCEKALEFKIDETCPMLKCDLYIDNELICTVEDPTKKKLREMASQRALELIKLQCPTLHVKKRFISDTTIDRDAASKGDSDTKNVDLQFIPLSDDNVGNKLLRMMGWTGGGLGKDKQGIAEPISVQQRIRREGLGNMANRMDFERKVRAMIRDYAENDSMYDLVFSTDFSSEERAIMHQIARRFKLKSRSYGKDADRHLVVAKKINMANMVDKLLREGGSNERYELILPTGLNNSV